METIRDLITFCKSIPENEWIGSAFEETLDGVTKRCVAGHINHHFTGKAFHEIDDTEPAKVLCDKLNISRFRLVITNNDAYHLDKNIKEEVINYLKSLEAA